MTIKVSKTSDPKKVAGAISSHIRDDGAVDIVAVGPIALNQAIKSIIIARSYLVVNNLDVNTVPSFSEVAIEDEKRTGIQLSLEKKVL